jgi:hypothetical protein
MQCGKQKIKNEMKRTIILAAVIMLREMVAEGDLIAITQDARVAFTDLGVVQLKRSQSAGWFKLACKEYLPMCHYCSCLE